MSRQHQAQELTTAANSDQLTAAARRTSPPTHLLRRIEHPNLVCIASLHAVEILAGASFIDRLFCNIFRAECKVLPWLSQPVAILAHEQTLHDTRISSIVLHNPAQSVKKSVYLAIYVFTTPPKMLFEYRNKPCCNRT